MHLIKRQGENTFAIVNCDNEFTTDELRCRIEKAVTNWIKQTDEGKNEWNNACSDLNIGDLANISHGTGSLLGGFLSKEGVDNLQIIVLGSEKHNWNFDTVLAEESVFE